MTPATPSTPPRLRAAYVRRLHGVRGEVRAEMLGGDVHRFRRGLRLRVEATGRSLVVRSARDGGEGTALLRFQGVDAARDAAELRGAYLCVDPAEARQLGESEWFTWELIGLRAVTPDGEELGTITDVEPARAADVLVIATRGSVRRFPMVREFVRDVDVGAGTLTLAPLPEEGSA